MCFEFNTHTYCLLVTTSDLPTTASSHTTILYSSTMKSMTLPTPTLSANKTNDQVLSTASPSSTPFPETSITVLIVCVVVVMIAGLMCGGILVLVLMVKKYRVGQEDVSNEVSTELKVGTQHPQSGEEFLVIHLVGSSCINLVMNYPN